MTRGRLLIFLLPAAFLLGAIWFFKQPPPKHSYQFPIMGTIASMTFHTESAKAELAAEAVRTVFHRIQKLGNLYDSDSELSRLNASAEAAPFACSDELWDILLAARRGYECSEGAFDISAKPLMDLWGFYRKRETPELPSAAETEAALAKVGLRFVRFDDAAKTVFFTRPGMALDLGGIAKGYAVDRAAEAVLALGIDCGVIDLGGNLRTLPKPPPGKECYTIGIKNPAAPGRLLPETIEMRGNSVATSGDYERFVEINGRRYGHIMDISTGRPVEPMRAATVVTPLALDADILSTTVFIRGAEWTQDHKTGLPEGTTVYFFRGDTTTRVNR